MSTDQPLVAIPTNIITGFLGVGKTTAILQLLRNKPSNERWAVLVNEFGEIGIDGSLLKGHTSEAQGVHIREVPGGCMCCAAGLPMQHALNQLLAAAKLDRLLIEPSGLGHPKEVLEVLSSGYFKNTLALQKTVTLIDARKLADQRYTDHATFQQQLAIADLVVANKQDLYQANEKELLLAYLAKHDKAGLDIHYAQHGAFDPTCLNGPTAAVAEEAHLHASHEPPVLDEQPLPECGYLKATNQGEGFHTVGWRFAGNKIFQHDKLFSILCGIEAERMKGGVYYR